MYKKIAILAGVLMLTASLAIAAVVFSATQKAEYQKRFNNLLNKASSYVTIPSTEKAEYQRYFNESIDEIEKVLKDPNMPESAKVQIKNSFDESLREMELGIADPTISASVKIKEIKEALLAIKAGIKDREEDKIYQQKAEQERIAEQKKWQEYQAKQKAKEEAERKALEEKYAPYFTVEAGQGKTYHGHIINGNYYYVVPYTEVKPYNPVFSGYCPYRGAGGKRLCIWSYSEEDVLQAGERACATSLPAGYDSTWITLNEWQELMKTLNSPCFNTDPNGGCNKTNGSFLTRDITTLYRIENLALQWKYVKLKSENGRMSAVLLPHSKDSAPQHVSFQYNVLCKVLDPNKSKAYIKIKKPPYYN